MEQHLQEVFEQGVVLFEEGDLRAALRYFRTYLAQGGKKRKEAQEYLKRIRELAAQAGETHRSLGNLRLANEHLDLMMASTEDPEARKPITQVPGPPKLREFQSPIPPQPKTVGRLCRRPHMDLSNPLPLAPGDSLEVRVYADESGAGPGEVTENIELPDTGAAFYDLEVRLLTSAHFRLDGNGTRPFRIERANVRTQTVVFAVSVIEARALSQVSGRPASVCAEFLFQGRPSGKVMRNIEIEGVSLTPVQAPPAGLPPLRHTIEIGPTAKSADLLITVTTQKENDNRHFWCTVKTALLPEYAEGVTDEWNLPVVTNTLVSGFMQEFAKPGLGKIERLAKLRGAGKELYKTSPKVFQEVFWKLVALNGRLRTISIVSDEPFVPWELMIPHRDVGPGVPPEIRDALGVEFQVGRMIRRWHVAGAQKIPLKNSYVVAPVFDGPRNLPHAVEEAAFITKLFPGSRIDPANFDSLDTKLDSCASLLHFACHGEVTDGKQILYLDDEKEFSAVDLCGLRGPEKGIAKAQPLVFLNACQVGRPVPSLVGVGGFAATFAEMGARAVIAPLWSVKDSIANEIAKDFYTKANKDKSIPFAEILRLQRGKAYNPAIAEDTYAAYCFYGDPLAVPE